MKMTVASPRQRLLRLLGLTALCALAFLPLTAQDSSSQVQPQIQPRIAAEVNGNALSILRGSQYPLAQARFEAGRVPANTRLSGITIVFIRSADQEAELQALLKAQQDPSSPQYHQWLTPEVFAAHFGMAQADLDKVQGWLEGQGFTIDSVNNSRNAVRFSGSVGQVERSFATEMHYYNVSGVKHFAPSTALSVPTAIAPVVAGIGNLNDFRPQPMHIRGSKSTKGRAGYTFEGSNGSEGVFFAPGDIKVAYDITPVTGGGNSGTGQTIAVMGQSAIQTVDIENFQQAAGLAVKDPVLTLVPGTGTSVINPSCPNGTTYNCGGDEGESDLDIEWAGAIAPGAAIDFIYTGNSNNNNGVFDSYEYAVDNKIGTIITMSYGACEPELGQTAFTHYEQVGEQAASQGQTVLAASGDQGSTACNGDQGATTAQEDELSVNYPASSAYVTGLGGTEMTQANATPGSSNSYWEQVSSSGNTCCLLTTLLKYVPEVAWNDDVITINGQTDRSVSASGGGTSTFTARPSWQTGVAGIPSGQFRLVPDVSLYSSPNFPGYLFCSSDEWDWFPGDNQGHPPQTASCGNNAFYDPVNGYFTAAGGTSFAAPIFAGMLADLNQAKGYTTGQGVINQELYTLAANSSTYASAFHDVTSGNNNCTAGSTYCGSQTGGFSAGTGYDEVTGLGSVDLNNLVTAWTESNSTLVGTSTTISASNTAPTVNQSVSFTITVAAASGAVVPSGTISISVDGGTATSETLASNGTYVYSTSFTTAGAHTVSASYAANSAFGGSTGSSTVNVQAVSSGTGAFALSFNPATLTVSQGSSGTEVLTVTPSNGYTGTVELTDNTSNNTALAGLCLIGGTGIGSDGRSIVVSNATTAVTGQIIVETNGAESDCATEESVAALSKRGLHVIPLTGSLWKQTGKVEKNPAPLGFALAGLLLAGFLGRGSRKLRGLACVLALAAIGLAMTACGSGAGGGGIPNPPKGTYTITFTGQDQANPTITNSSAFTLTID